MKKLIKVSALIISFFLPEATWAQVQLRLPSILSDHAVLQESSDCKLWGWGPGAQTLKIVCSWNDKDTTYVPIDASCIWETTIKTPAEPGPFNIKFICGKQLVTIQDLLLGEAWLCSGQSNMEFNSKWGLSNPVDLNTSANNSIRFFEIEKDYDEYPRSDCKGKWVICDKNTIPNFSAIGYFFGKKLNKVINKPVGLVGSYWGGTCIQAWMPKESFESDSIKRFASNIEAWGWAPKGASGLYNSMINPVSKYKFAGVLWYQGEANVDSDYNDYSKLLSSMVTMWRSKFKSDLPFYLVQIAPWNGYAGIKAAYLREQQELASKNLPGVGMVSVADLVDDLNDIHPKNKEDAGERLANFVVSKQYFPQSEFNHPCIESWNILGSKIVLNIKSSDKLRVFGKNKLGTFQIAGDDKIFHEATIVKNVKNKVVIESKKVIRPVAFRYCFTNDAIPDLFDVNGLPLLQYRSDNW